MILTPAIITDFRASLLTNEKADNTIDRYIRDVSAFLTFVGTSDLSKDIVIRYKRHLEESGDYELTSINTILCSINAFMKYLDLPQYKVAVLKIQHSPYQSADRELTEEGQEMRIPENICLECLNRVKRVKLKPSDCRFDNPYPSFCAACGEYRAVVTGLTWKGRVKTVGKK